MIIRLGTPEDVDEAAQLYISARHAAFPAVPPFVDPDHVVRAWFTNEALDQ
jgi:hypothetical protein